MAVLLKKKSRLKLRMSWIYFVKSVWPPGRPLVEFPPTPLNYCLQFSICIRELVTLKAFKLHSIIHR